MNTVRSREKIRLFFFLIIVGGHIGASYMTSKYLAPWTNVVLTPVTVLAGDPVVAATSVFALEFQPDTLPPPAHDAEDERTWNVQFTLMPGPSVVINNYPQPWLVYVGGDQITIAGIWVDNVRVRLAADLVYDSLRIDAIPFNSSRVIQTVNISLTATNLAISHRLLPPLVYAGETSPSVTDNYTFVIKVMLIVSASLGLVVGAIVYLVAQSPARWPLTLI